MRLETEANRRASSFVDTIVCMPQYIHGIAAMKAHLGK